MKTLIFYGTKYGFAEKCSRLLKDKLQGEVTTINIKKDSIPDIAFFDNIIIGGSIYMGQMHKEIKDFCMKNLNVLKDKKVGLFICGLNDANYKLQLDNSFPETLAANAAAVGYFGGEVIFRNMNFFERFIMKKVGKTDKDVSNLLEDNISEFARVFNS